MGRARSDYRYIDILGGHEKTNGRQGVLRDWSTRHGERLDAKTHRCSALSGCIVRTLAPIFGPCRGRQCHLHLATRAQTRQLELD